MSDDEEQYNPQMHSQLLKAIGSLGKTQHIRRTTRSEPKPVQDEFQLVKRHGDGDEADDASAGDAKQAVAIGDLMGMLSGTKRHLDVGKQLRNVKQSKKVLERPLEKPAAERIKRTVGYERVQEKLSQWDAVVAKNRNAEQQVFPLKSETIYIDTFAHSKPLQMSVKSQVALELQATEEQLKQLKKARDGISPADEAAMERLEQELLHKKMTRDELRAKRNELALLRMRESQKSAKARMQNKIKSKKFHKLMKRQKIKEQMKEFELLQKTDPEAALAKLNELEKNRVLERANLRHKNTGSWAKNLQVRAKYDKDVRKDLAEQLQISRQLTSKKDAQSESDEGEGEEEEDEHVQNGAGEMPTEEEVFNPWMRAGKKGRAEKEELDENSPNYRQYWLDRNRDVKLLEEYKKDDKDEATSEDEVEEKEEQNGDVMNQEDSEEEEQLVEKVKSKATKVTKTESTKATKKKANKRKALDAEPEPKKKAKTAKKAKVENGWVVEEVDTPIAKSIDDIFDEREDAVRSAVEQKLQKLAKAAKHMDEAALREKKRREQPLKQKDALKNLKDLSFKETAKRPQIDEALHGSDDDDDDTETPEQREDPAKKQDAAKNAATVNQVSTQRPSSDVAGDNIDPHNLPEIKLKQHLVNPLAAFDDAMAADGDYIDGGADDDEDDAAARALSDQQMTISQAFEDDDIVADFSRDKAKDSQLKNTELNLTLPGWGSWAGAGMTDEELARSNENKRLVLKLAPEEKRRDDSKGHLYINEATSKKLRTHLVSDVPFPFTTLEDYEASIRAPIGRSFVPETAFRMLTRPAVITMKGQVIEPMDETELLKPERPLRNIVDRRIRKMEKKAEKKGRL